MRIREGPAANFLRESGGGEEVGEGEVLRLGAFGLEREGEGAGEGGRQQDEAEDSAGGGRNATTDSEGGGGGGGGGGVNRVRDSFTTKRAKLQTASTADWRAFARIWAGAVMGLGRVGWVGFAGFG